MKYQRQPMDENKVTFACKHVERQLDFGIETRKIIWISKINFVDQFDFK